VSHNERILKIGSYLTQLYHHGFGVFLFWTTVYERTHHRSMLHNTAYTHSTTISDFWIT